MPTEDQLCLAFAERMKDSPEFRSWVLNRTKFRNYEGRTRLLHEEQMTLRPRKYWWRHWWCHVPELKKDHETDIFMVFETIDTGQRFALHVENKKDNGRFAEGQAEAYRIRARHMANKADYLSYEDFETMLISPLSFRAKYPTACDSFDCFLSYEDIAGFVSEFGSVSSQAATHPAIPRWRTPPSPG